MLSLLLVARKIFASSSPQQRYTGQKLQLWSGPPASFFPVNFCVLLRERGRDLQKLLEQRENELLQGGHRQLITIGTGRNGGSRSLLDPRENELLQQGGALVSY